MTAFFKSFPRACPGPAPGRGIDRPTCTDTEPPATQEFTMPLKSPFRSGRRAPAAALAALAAMMTMLAPGSGSAQVLEPPLLPQDITVFPERDFTSISGFAPNADLLVEVVKRNGAVTKAEGRTDATGFMEVNHPGGVCWIGTTPDIAPADLVRVTYGSTDHNRLNNPTVVIGSGSSTTTQNVTATQAVVVQQGSAPNITYTVVVKGQAQLLNGTRIPLDRLEVRIINRDFIGGLTSRITRRDIRADSTGGRVAGPPGATGTLAYDGTATTFTAIFSGLNADERLLAVEGQTRVMGWQQTTTAGDRLGMTIYEVGELGGPGIGGCPAGPNGVVPPNNPAPPVHYVPLDLKDAANPLDQPSLRDVTVFPERDFVSIDGFPAGTDLQVVVRRGSSNTPVVGTARGLVGRNGLFEVNHPGGVCWTGQTPDIGPGDWIDVFEVRSMSFSSGQTQRVINTTIKKPAYANNGLVRVEGIAVDAGGRPFPLRLTEQRIINPDFKNTRIGRRDMRADINGGRVGDIGTGLLSPKGGGKWEAVYSGLNVTERQVAVAGQSRAMAWHSTNPDGDRFGMTIYEAGEVGGPGIGGCPARGSASIGIP